MPKCIVVRLAFSPLGIVISLEGCVVSNNVPSCINKSVAQYARATFGHTSRLSLKVTRLINRWIQTGKGKQLVRMGKRWISPISPRIIPPLRYPIPGMVMMTESLNFMISVVSVSILSSWLSSNSICWIVWVIWIDIALSFAPTDFCARTLNSLACSLVKCPCEFTLSRFARMSHMHGNNLFWRRCFF